MVQHATARPRRRPNDGADINDRVAFYSSRCGRENVPLRRLAIFRDSAHGSLVGLVDEIKLTPQQRVTNRFQASRLSSANLGIVYSSSHLQDVVVSSGKKTASVS